MICLRFLHEGFWIFSPFAQKPEPQSLHGDDNHRGAAVLDEVTTWGSRGRSKYTDSPNPVIPLINHIILGPPDPPSTPSADNPDAVNRELLLNATFVSQLIT